MHEFKYLLLSLTIVALLGTAHAGNAGPRESPQPASGSHDTIANAPREAGHVATTQHLSQGRQLENRSDLAGAIAAYRLDVANSPRSAEAHFALGKALLEAGSLQGALPSLTFAIRLDPDHTGALLERARLCLRLGLHAQALKDLDRLIDISPGVADYHYQRARALMKLECITDAFRDFLRAHELDPRYPRPTLHGQDKIIGGKLAVAPDSHAMHRAQPRA